MEIPTIVHTLDPQPLRTKPNLSLTRPNQQPTYTPTANETTMQIRLHYTGIQGGDFCFFVLRYGPAISPEHLELISINMEPVNYMVLFFKNMYFFFKFYPYSVRLDKYLN